VGVLPGKKESIRQIKQKKKPTEEDDEGFFEEEKMGPGDEAFAEGDMEKDFGGAID
jgi:hypothetical protein